MSQVKIKLVANYAANNFVVELTASLNLQKIVPGGILNIE